MESMRCTIDIHVIPKSSQSKIILKSDGTFKAYLHSPPSDGKANDELVRLLSKVLGVTRGDITIIHGDRGRHKRVMIEGMEHNRATALISTIK